MFNITDLSRISNSYFSMTTGSISPTKFSIEKFSFAEHGSKAKFLVLIYAAHLWQSKYSKKCFLFSYRWLIKLLILNHYKFDFLHQDLTPKHSFGTPVFSYKKSLFFSHASESWPSKTSNKKSFNFIFFDIQTQLSP